MDWKTADPWAFVDHPDFLECDNALFEDRINHVLACIEGRDQMDDVDLKWTILLLIQWCADKFSWRYPMLAAWQHARTMRILYPTSVVENARPT